MNLSDVLMYRALFPGGGGGSGADTNSVIGCVGGRTDKTVPTMEFLETPGITYYRVADHVEDMYFVAILAGFSGDAGEDEAEVVYFGISGDGSPPMMVTNESGSFAVGADGTMVFTSVPDGSAFLGATTATEGGLYVRESFLEYNFWAITYLKKSVVQ